MRLAVRLIAAITSEIKSTNPFFLVMLGNCSRTIS